MNALNRMSDERIAEIESQWRRTGLSETGFDWNAYGCELLQALKAERLLAVLTNEHTCEVIADLAESRKDFGCAVDNAQGWKAATEKAETIIDQVREWAINEHECTPLIDDVGSLDRLQEIVK